MRFLARQVEEIRALADDDSIAVTGIPPDLKLGCISETGFHDVDTIAPQRGNEPRQGYWKLVVDKEFHELARITWSDCRAAYSMAARMSSFSRNE